MAFEHVVYFVKTDGETLLLQRNRSALLSSEELYGGRLHDIVEQRCAPHKKREADDL
jgi:hypothetical protein